MNIKINVAKLREEIAEVCLKVGRSPEEINILAATKGRNVAEIRKAIEAGIKLSGENTVQEALAKFEFLPSGIEKHFIGHLQKNKAKIALRLFDMIESVDSLELAEELSHESLKLGKRMPILIEVKVTEGAGRWGVRTEELFSLIPEIVKLEGVQFQGLMAMPPYHENPEELRPYFRRMKELADELKDLPGVKLKYLSMGISNDFKVAIEEGSNLIRIGTKIFGPRS